MPCLQNKVALITGGSKGIGLATAQLFIQEGARVVITARNKEELEKANLLIPEALAIQSDISNLYQLEALFKEIHSHYGNIDILFANAGVATRAWIGDVTEEIFDNVININYKGTFFTVQKAIPYLNKKASIILNASIAGVFALDHHSIYSSAKAAVIQMAKTFAADLAQFGTRVNSVSPGYIRTPLWNQWLEENPEKYKKLCEDVPFEQRFGSAKELAQTVLFLASEQSSYMTAQNLIVDGGLTSIVMEFNTNNEKN